MFRKVLLLTFLEALTAQAAALRTEVEQTAEDDTSERVQELEAQAEILHTRARQVYQTFYKTESERFVDNIHALKNGFGEEHINMFLNALKMGAGADNVPVPQTYQQPEKTADVIEESTAEQPAAEELANERLAAHPLARKFPHLAQ